MDAAFEILSDQFNGQIMEGLGFIIVVQNVVEIGNGKILHGDAATYHTVKFNVLCYTPEMHEIVEGNVVEVVEFGAFVRLGPSDGLVHVSQICDDYISYENMAQRFYGKETNKTLVVNDTVRARIIAVSMGSGRSSKLGLTMRQAFLGKSEWVTEALDKIYNPDKKTEVKDASEGKKSKDKADKGSKPKTDDIEKEV
jgi:DNA-directed RNA polymerase subunit E'